MCFPESGGARVQQGAAGLSAYGAIFRAEAIAKVPVISVVAGACAGGAAYGAAVGDLTIAAGDDVKLFLTGPRVVEEITREKVTAIDLGGVKVHSANGVIHLTSDDDHDAAQLVREVLGYLPARLATGPRPACPASRSAATRATSCRPRRARSTTSATSRAASSTAASCSSSARGGRATSSPASAASTGCRSACSPTSPAIWAGRSTCGRPRRAPGSSTGASG